MQDKRHKKTHTYFALTFKVPISLSIESCK